MTDQLGEAGGIVAKESANILVQILKDGAGLIEPGLMFLVIVSCMALLNMTPLKRILKKDQEQLFVLGVSVFYGLCFLIYHGVVYGGKAMAVFSINTIISMFLGLLLYYLLQYIIKARSKK